MSYMEIKIARRLNNMVYTFNEFVDIENYTLINLKIKLPQEEII